MKYLHLFVAVAGLAVAACGGGDDDASVPTVTFAPSITQPSTTAPSPATSEPASTPTVSPTTAMVTWPPSQELLDQAVLPISDMPTGWAAIPDDGEDSEPPCGVGISTIAGVDEIPSGRAQYAEDENFGPLVMLSAGVLPPDLGNLDVLGTLEEAMLDCRTNIEGFDVSYSELSYPTLGDQSFALRQSATKDGTTVIFDAVQARSGDVVIQVAGADFFGDATDILEQFAERQLDLAVEILG